MPLPTQTVTIEIDGYEDAQRLAAAIALLRKYAEMRGHKDVMQFADEAEESLQSLDITVERPL